jgi:putative ABC transport system substrate-binding protein
MDRRTFLAGTGAVVLATPLAAAAQPTKKVWRLGMFNAGARLPESVAGQDGFREELRSLGYVAGQNVVYEERWADGHAERLPDLAGELVRSNVDVIVVVGTAQAMVAKRVTARTPIVVVSAVLPVEMGLVASLARPGGNVTGTTLDAGSLEMAKRLQLFQEVLPRGLPILVSSSSSYPGAEIYLEQAREAATQLGMTLEMVDIQKPEDDVVSLIGRKRVGGLLVGLYPAVAGQGKRIIELAIQKRWPTIFAGQLAKRFVEAGGLMSYSANREEAWRRAAAHVDKIFKGAKPADVPMEQPTKFDLVINLKTAKALGLTIPPSLLLRVDQVIE